MGAALGNDHALNVSAAALTYFYSSTLVIRLQVLIVIAGFSLQVAIAAKGGSSVLNAPRKHRNNARVQHLYFSACQRAGTAQGVY